MAIKIAITFMDIAYFNLIESRDFMDQNYEDSFDFTSFNCTFITDTLTFTVIAIVIRKPRDLQKNSWEGIQIN